MTVHRPGDVVTVYALRAGPDRSYQVKVTLVSQNPGGGWTVRSANGAEYGLGPSATMIPMHPLEKLANEA